MKFKLYVATPVVVEQETGRRFYFTSSPNSGGTDTIEFEYYNNYPDTGSTATITVPLLAVPTPYTNEQMASDFRSFASLSSSLTAIYEDGTTYASIFMNNGSPIINVVYSDSFGYSDGILEDVTINQWNQLAMFKDETIEITNKLNDIEKLSNVFMDLTNTFTVPAAENNHIFKHYYDSDIDDPINANIRLDAYLEVDSFPFRYGKVQIEGVTLKKQRVDSYKVTFYGGLLQLTDLFGDDTIDRLDYDKVITSEGESYTQVRTALSQFDFEYNSANLFSSLTTSSFKDGDIITPLIAYADRDWEYGSSNSLDISTNTGAIKDVELFQALRIIRIIEAIEAKYKVSFSRDFLGTATFNNLFMWLNGNENPLSPENVVDLQDALTDAGSWQPAPDIFIDDFIQLDTGNDYLTINVPRIGTTVRDFADCEFWIRPLVYNLSNTLTQFKVIARDYDTGNIIAESEIRTGNDTTSSPSLFMKFKQRSEDYTVKVKFTIQLLNTATFDFRVFINMFVTPSVSGPAYPDRVRQTLPNTQTVIANRTMSNTLPKMKVVEFLQGLMKQFKLIIRPLSGNQFYLDTLNNYYANGNVLDISEYIDNETCVIERPEIYKTIKFKYQKTENVAGKKYRELNDPFNNEIGYGDLNSVYLSIESKNELNVELPFENMLFERMPVVSPSAKAGEITDWLIGQSISTSDNSSFNKNNSKPILFFDNGLISNTDYPIKVKFGGDAATEVVYTHLVGNTNDELIDQVTDTINFNSEVDPWHGQIVANSLYLNYWENWVNTIYDLKQRKFTFEGFLPPRYVEELSLNDRLLIGSNRYKINDYKINLSNGSTKLTLFKDIYEWNEYSFPSGFVFNERSFSPNGWFMTDTINNGDSAYIYGSFSGYNSTNYGRIIKLLPNGDVASDFNTGTGFNNNSFGFQSIYKQNDGKILATGDFTSFNGTAMNRLARLNTDGSLDSSLVIGTGFNNVTSGVDVDSQGRIIVAGTFTSYSGVSSRCIIRLTSGGTVDTAVGLNGFSNATNSVVVNSDDSLYVGGYFTGFSGTVSNRLIKLTSGFTVDSSFNVGAGLNSNTSNQPVGLVADVDDGVFVYGFFTTYSGQSANRMVRLKKTGQIHPDWYIGSGFNNSISSVYKVLNDKLLVYGPYTQFNGLSVPNGLLVLNPDGSIYRNFNGNYVNVFTIGNRFYGNLANGVTELIDDEELPILSSNSIIANAGAKYYSVNVLKNLDWSVTTVDLGYGTDWVTITTPTGTTSSEVVFRVEDKSSQSAPDLYEPRYMYLRFDINGVYRDVLITQNGLEA